MSVSELRDIGAVGKVRIGWKPCGKNGTFGPWQVYLMRPGKKIWEKQEGMRVKTSQEAHRRVKEELQNGGARRFKI